jgi:hypothetical protein
VRDPSAARGKRQGMSAIPEGALGFYRPFAFGLLILEPGIVILREDRVVLDPRLGQRLRRLKRG